MKKSMITLIFKRALLISLGATTMSCASFMNSGDQSISLQPVVSQQETDETKSESVVPEVQIKLNDGNSAYQANLPLEFKVKSHHKPLSFEITDPCFEPYEGKIPRHFHWSYWLNILNLYGFAVDYAAGTQWRYTKHINVPVTSIESCNNAITQNTPLPVLNSGESISSDYSLWFGFGLSRGSLSREEFSNTRYGENHDFYGYEIGGRYKNWITSFRHASDGDFIVLGGDYTGVNELTIGRPIYQFQTSTAKPNAQIIASIGYTNIYYVVENGIFDILFDPMFDTIFGLDSEDDLEERKKQYEFSDYGPTAALTLRLPLSRKFAIDLTAQQYFVDSFEPTIVKANFQFGSF